MQQVNLIQMGRHPNTLKYTGMSDKYFCKKAGPSFRVLLI